MNRNADELYPAFHAEVSEQLEHLELALINQERTGEVDVNQLFREFHTVKSSSAMFGFTSMEKIAHASEDYLDLLRKGSANLSGQAVDILLESVDCLKQQLSETESTRENPSANPELLGRLLSMAGSVQRSSLESEHDSRGIAVVNSATGEVGQLSDAEAEQFSKACLQALTRVVDPEASPKVIRSELQKLESLSNLLSFHAIRKQLRRLIKSLQTGDLFVVDNVPVIADIFDRLRYFETALDRDCGVNQGVNRCVSIYANNHDQLASDLSGLLGDLELKLKNSSMSAAMQLCGKVSQQLELLITLSKLLQFHETGKLLRYGLQVLREIERGNLALSRPLFDAIAGMRSFLQSLHGLRAEDSTFESVARVRYDEIHGNVVRSMQSDESRVLLDRLLQKLDFSQEQLRGLSDDALEQLDQAIQSRATVGEIEIDVESSSGIGELLVNWIVKMGRVLNSRTVFIDTQLNGQSVEKTHIAFLVVMPMASAAVQAALDAIDHNKSCHVWRLCGQRREQKTPVSAATPASAASSERAGSSTLRVDASQIDDVMALIGEMVMLRNMMSHAMDNGVLQRALQSAAASLVFSDADERAMNLQVLKSALGEIDTHFEALYQADQRIQDLVSRLQQDVLELRVVPIALVFNRLPQMVDKLAAAQHKDIDLQIEGESVRIDKSMVDILMEPMVHLVRNCIDHGIEPVAERQASGKTVRARLTVRAIQQGNTLVIEVSDDGRGLNQAKIREKAYARGLIPALDAKMTDSEVAGIIFLPGFSTSDVLTETSGRGVGMDVVKTRITQLGGSIDISSEAGRGTRFMIRLPLSVAIQGVVRVTTQGRRFAIPERSITEVVKLRTRQLCTVLDHPACRLRGEILPLFTLGPLVDARLQNETDWSENPGDREILVATHGQHRIGIVVDALEGRQEVFVRDIHPELKALPGIAGGALLGDGSIIFIVDMEYIFSMTRARSHAIYGHGDV